MKEQDKEIHIPLEALEEIFNKISESTPWDMNKPMLWGYFFTHSERELLEKAKDNLIALGYRFVDIYLADKQDLNEADVWWLHIEKEELHTPETLFKRNGDFRDLAACLGLNSYDGMDVGPIQ